MPETDTEEHERPARPLPDNAKFYSIVVESSGASPIVMTGRRDKAKQDDDLRDVFRTRKA